MAHVLKSQFRQSGDMTASNNLLIIDDDETFCSILQRGLSQHDLNVRYCTRAADALSVAQAFQPAYIVLDLRLGDDSGMDLIEPLHTRLPHTDILVLTGFASLATAVHAIKLGAHDYLPKPVDEIAVLRALGLQSAPVEEPEIPETPVSLKRLEWEQIQRVLQENDGNITTTAKRLGMYRRTLQRKLQKKPSKW
jgi:two-component system response regulator RegA